MKGKERMKNQMEACWVVQTVETMAFDLVVVWVVRTVVVMVGRLGPSLVVLSVDPLADVMVVTRAAVMVLWSVVE